MDPGGPRQGQRQDGAAGRRRRSREGLDQAGRQARPARLGRAHVPPPQQAQRFRHDGVGREGARHRPGPDTGQAAPRGQAGGPTGRPDRGPAPADRRRRARPAGHASLDRMPQGIPGQGLRRAGRGEARQAEGGRLPAGRPHPPVRDRARLRHSPQGRRGGQHVAARDTARGPHAADPAHVRVDRAPGQQVEARGHRPGPRHQAPPGRLPAALVFRGRRAAAAGPATGATASASPQGARR